MFIFYVRVCTYIQDAVQIIKYIRSGKIPQIEIYLDTKLYMGLEEWVSEMADCLGTKDIVYQLPFPMIALLCSRIKDLPTVMDMFPKFPWTHYVCVEGLLCCSLSH